MADFSYIKTDGSSGTVSAPDANTALATAPGIAAHSGVQSIAPSTPTAPATTPQVTTPPPPTTTPAQAYKGLNAPTADPYDAALGGAVKTAAAAASAAPDESAIYQNKLAMYQAQIDATNKIYADKLAAAKIQGTSDLGSGRAIQARSGTLGSDFGFAQTAKINDANTATYSGIQNEGNAAVAAILGEARTDAAKEYADKVTAQQKGLSDYLTYLGTQSQRRDANIQKVAGSILDQGLTPDQIDPAQLKQIADTYGISPSDITAAFATAQKAQADKNLTQSKDNSFNLNPGETHYTYDPVTGKTTATASVPAVPKTLGTPATGVYQQNADGSYTQVMAPVGGDNVQSLAQELVTGNLAPADLSKRASGVGSYNDILTAANTISQNLYGKPFDIAKASTDYTYANNKTTQDTLNFLGSLVGSADGTTPSNLDQLVTLSKQVNKPGFLGIGETSFPALNNAEQWAKLSSGDPTVAAYYANLTEVSDQIAKILQGGGGGGTSDAKLAQAQGLFQKGFTPDQIEAVAGSLKPLLLNRGVSMVKDNPYLSSYALQFGIAQNNNKTPAPTTDSSAGFGWNGN